MKVKKIPMRTCIVTKEKCEKKQLVRIVRTPLKEVVIDESGKQNGRGAYIKLSKEVIDKAKKSKVLDRALEIEVPQTIYEELTKMLEK